MVKLLPILLCLLLTCTPSLEKKKKKAPKAKDFDDPNKMPEDHALPMKEAPKKIPAEYMSRTASVDNTCPSQRPEGTSDVSCVGGLQKYPTTMEFSSHYKKLCYTKKGLPVAASANVRDQAVNRMAFLFDKLIGNWPDKYVQKLKDINFKIVVIAASPLEGAYDIPERQKLGHNPTGYRFVAGPPSGIAEEHLLCYPNDGYRGREIAFHEIAHALMGQVLNHDGDFWTRLGELYNKQYSNSTSIWKGHYAMAHVWEYFAEAVSAFFDGCYGITRDVLARNDPGMLTLLTDYMNWDPKDTWRFSC